MATIQVVTSIITTNDEGNVDAEIRVSEPDKLTAIHTYSIRRTVDGQAWELQTADGRVVETSFDLLDKGSLLGTLSNRHIDRVVLEKEFGGK